MPQALVPIFVNLGFDAFWASVAAEATVIAGTVALEYGAQALLGGTGKNTQSQSGSFNFRQPVPPLRALLGKNKHGGDYFLLEERNGNAYHGIVYAGHHIKGYDQFWLNDETATLNDDGAVTAPDHFIVTNELFHTSTNVVRFWSRLGEDAETAYDELVSVFPEFWDANHRGDGLPSILMRCATVSQDDFQKVYPQQMPTPTVVTEGNDRIYDPRTGTYDYSENIALFRLWHLTQPHGGKLSLDDLYLPDWSHAADVCDQSVTDKLGNTKPRYWGGLRYAFSDDQVQVGGWLDQAGELVIYDRPDGLVGVHAGAFVEPDVTLTVNDLISLSYDANTRRVTTVLAVRGQFTDPHNQYSTSDAAIYGNPYVGDDDSERTKTITNPAVRWHNHMQRLQKLAYIRANAPTIKATTTYENGRQIRTRRFIRVNLPPRLNNAVVEITGTPQLNLQTLTVDFTGIVVPETLYDFDPTTDEGTQPPIVVDIDGSGIPDPTGFSISIGTEVVAGGQTGAFAVGSWTHQSDALTYELQWQKVGDTAAQSVMSASGDDEVRTSGYLEDSASYQFRLRTWSAKSAGNWTDWITRTAVADTVAPDMPDGVSAAGGSGSALIDFTSPGNVNFATIQIYHNTADDFDAASLADKLHLAPSTASNDTITGLVAGDHYFWVTAANWSDVESDPVATGAVTVS